MKKMYFGQQVSEHGKAHGFVDYRTLSKVVGDTILCNDMESRFYKGVLELEHGEMTKYYDAEGNEVSFNSDEIEEEESKTVYQWYIISDEGAEFLTEHTNELVFFDSEISVNVWGVTHCGTSWDYVLTDVEI